MSIRRFLSYEYLTREHLIGFDKYKYSCVDNSPISRYVMHPLWDRMVKIYPRWLAPNLITMSGFVCLIVQFILCAKYDYSFYGWCESSETCASAAAVLNLTRRQLHFQTNIDKYDGVVPVDVCSCIPPWFWLAIGICQFLSHNLDGTDGKQARRTGSSSPLGELFDHGIDSWATLFLPCAIFSIFGRAEPFGFSAFRLYTVLWLIMGSFILTHWEKYNTGILFLPWSYDLSQIGMTFWFLVTYFIGLDFWHMRVIPSSNMSLNDIIEIFIYACSIGLSLPFTIYNVFEAQRQGKLKQANLYETIRPLLPVLYLYLIQLIWIKYSRVNILELEPRAFLWLTGTLFSNIVCRLIVAQMTSTRVQIFNWVLVPLTLVVLLFTCSSVTANSAWMPAQLAGYLSRDAEVNSLYALAGLVTVVHVHFGYCVVNQICKHLNIYCFVITSRPSDFVSKTK